LLNCDVSKINEFFILTEGELAKEERKLSSNDSDMVLSADDHMNAFSSEEKGGTAHELEKKAEHSDENELGHNEEEGEEMDRPQSQAKKNSEDSLEDVKEALEKEAYLNENENLEEKNLNQCVEQAVEVKDDEMTNLENELGIHQDLHEELAAIEENSNSLDKNKIEMLEHLLAFTETEKDLNYVLVGYFSKFFNLLINKFPNKILGYLYVEKPETLDNLLQHVSKKSISDLILKILLFENYITEKDQLKTANTVDKSAGSNVFSHMNNPLVNNLELVNSIRRHMLVSLFRKVNIMDHDQERIANLSLICAEIIENKNILEIVINEPLIIEHLFEQLAVDTNALKSQTSFDIEYNYSEILGILISIVRFVHIENLKIPSYINEEDIVNSEGESTGKIENTLLGELVLKNVELILKNFLLHAKNSEVTDTVDTFSTTLFDGTFGNPFRPLGNKRVKIVELIYCLCPYFKNIQAMFDRILIRAEFFPHLFNYFFEYEWNNFYQLNFENLIKHFLNNSNNHTEVIKHLFEEVKILDLFLVNARSTNRSESKDGFIFNSNRKINHGYFAISIELCHKIYTLHSNPLKKYFTPEWESYVHTEVINWKKLFERKLCTADSNPTSEEFFSDMIHPSSDNTTLDLTKKEDTFKESEYNAEEENSNPFTNKKDMNFFNMGNETDDWFNSKKNEEETNDVMLENINDFEFVDDQKAFMQERKISREDEEMMVKERNE